jgi:hypothetical protein
MTMQGCIGIPASNQIGKLFLHDSCIKKNTKQRVIIPLRARSSLEVPQQVASAHQALALGEASWSAA